MQLRTSWEHFKIGFGWSALDPEVREVADGLISENFFEIDLLGRVGWLVL